MVFNRKGSFFLQLDEKAAETPAVVAPVTEAPAKAKTASNTEAKVEVKAAAAPAAAAVKSESAAAPRAAAVKSESDAAPQAAAMQTTAEAIAAELAAEQAARPAKTDSTFAPECVTAGGALPMRRRRAGANVAGFRDMASGMFGKK